jgi:hypothetical protein
MRKQFCSISPVCQTGASAGAPGRVKNVYLPVTIISKDHNNQKKKNNITFF